MKYTVLALTPDNEMVLICRNVKLLREAKAIAEGAVECGQARASYVTKGQGPQVAAFRRPVEDPTEWARVREMALEVMK